MNYKTLIQKLEIRELFLTDPDRKIYEGVNIIGYQTGTGNFKTKEIRIKRVPNYEIIWSAKWILN